MFLYRLKVVCVHCVGVEEVLCNRQHACMGNSQLDVKEFYPFMNVEETDSVTAIQPVAMQPPPPKYVHQTHKEILTTGKCQFAKHSLDKLNESLRPIEAKATLESQILYVSPLDGASDLANWEDEVKRLCDEHFDNYREEVVQVSQEAKAEALTYVFSEDRRPPDVSVSLQGERLSISGSHDQVKKVIDVLKNMMLAAQISTKELYYARKLIKFLLKFCSQEISTAAPNVQYDTVIDQGIIRVTANPTRLAEFKALVEGQLRVVHENIIDLNPDLFLLFSSKRGEVKIAEVIGAQMASVVYDIEESQIHNDYILCILSKDEEISRSVRKLLNRYAHYKTIEVNQQKIRACTDQKWRELHSRLTSEHFVTISYRLDTCQITVSGYDNAIDDTIKQVEKFLRDHTSVEERVEVDRYVWNVVNSNFAQELSAIDSDARARHITITRPKSNGRQDTTFFLIRGEPKHVDDFKVQVTMLCMRVCQKEFTISNVPALVHVLGSMDDRINVLRSDNKASIDLHFERGTATGEVQATGGLPRKLCNATAANGSRVNVYMGDFTQNQPVTAILNFVSLDPHIDVGILKLLASAAGPEMRDDFKCILSQQLVRKPGLVFQTEHGQLKCSRLLHCCIPPWDPKDTATLVQCLETGLKDFVHRMDASSSVLITPITSKPLEYPVDVFSTKLLEVCCDKDVQVTVYVDEIEQARVFEELLTDKKFIVHTHVPVGQSPKRVRSSSSSLASGRVISNPITSFVSMTQGDMLKQQVSFDAIPSL